jgi:hypothetical protein
MPFVGPLHRALQRLSNVGIAPLAGLAIRHNAPRNAGDALPLARTVRMDDARLIAALGQQPLDQAVEPTLVGLAYFPASVNSESRARA